MARLRENHWERFARQNPLHYIDTRVGYQAGAAEEQRFYASGVATAKQILDEIAPLPDGHELAIELGCGIGRILLPMAQHFKHVLGVDVSQTMLDRLGQTRERLGVSNVRGIAPEEAWDAEAADLVYSYWVLQHIEDPRTIASYVRRAAGAIRPGGVAFLQFDTRPRSAAYKLKCRLPDPLLPPRWRAGIRRIRRTSPDLRRLFAVCGLEIVKELRPDSAEHAFVLRMRG